MAVKLRADLQLVEAAPLPVNDLHTLAREAVTILAARGSPSINIERGQFSIAWRQPGSSAMGMSLDDVAAFAAWLHRGALLKALEGEITAAAAMSRIEPLSVAEATALTLE